MNDYSGKYMLVVSFDSIGEAITLNIEKELHYWLKNRYFLTHEELVSLNKEEVIDDTDCVKMIGFWLFSLLFIPKSRIPPAALLSIQTDENGNSVLRFDGEVYQAKSHREFVKTIPLPSLDVDTIIEDQNLCFAIGKTILEELLSYE